jgi:hypothetical protein
MDDAQIAFLTEDVPAAVRINFGIFAGRQATAAEIDALAQRLLPLVEGLAIVAEDRHEIDEHSEAALASVRVEFEDGMSAAVADQLLERCRLWAQSCVDERHAEVSEL